MIRIHLIRHGKTIGNIKRQYIGRTDEALCAEGIRELLTKQNQGSYPPPERVAPVVFSSPMQRCIETARLLYPDCKIEILAGLQEMDFGPFEGKTYAQLSALTEYQEWIASQGEKICAGMEKRSQMQKRCGQAFEAAMQTFLDALERKSFPPELVFMVHGGTIMALMQEFGVYRAPEQGNSAQEDSYYRFQRENGCGITCSLIVDGDKESGKPILGLQWEGNIG